MHALSCYKRAEENWIINAVKYIPGTAPLPQCLVIMMRGEPKEGRRPRRRTARASRTRRQMYQTDQLTDKGV